MCHQPLDKVRTYHLVFPAIMMMIVLIMFLQYIQTIKMAIAPLAIVVTGTLRVVLLQPKQCWEVLIARVADVM